MDVEMPDGTIIEDVPEGVTRAEILKRYGMAKPMPEMSAVPDDYQINELPEFQALEEPGLAERMFSPSGNIGDPAPLSPQEAKQALGIMGATVGSIVAPRYVLPNLIARGTATIGGAGLGGATGEMLADTAFDKESNPAQDVLEYASAETLGHGIGKFAQGMLSPLASKVTDKARKLLEFSKKEKIPISAGALVPGMTEKVIKGGTDNFIPSRLVNQHYRGKMITRMNELMGQLPENVGQVLGKEESSLITTEAFRAASNAKQASAKRLRNEFLASVGPATVVPVKNTEKLLSKISPQVKDPALKEFIEVELASITNGAKSAEQLEQTLNQISSIRAKGADKKYLTEIREAAQADFKAAGADMEKLSNSSNFFKMNAELLSNPTARRLMKENLTSQQMTAQIFRTGNEGFVKQLSKELPRETWDSLRAQNLANLFENFSEQSQSMPGMRMLTKGDQLVKWIENNKSVLNEAYDPQTVEALENMAELAKATKGEMAAHGKELGMFGSTLNIGAIGGAGYAEPTTLMFSTPALMALSKSMMNPDGWIKQWLTTGIKGGKEIGEAAKFGGRTAVAGDDDSN